MTIKEQIDQLIKSEYAQYKLQESRDHDFGALSEKLGKLIANAAEKLPFNEYLAIVKTVKTEFHHTGPLRAAKKILSENTEKFGDKNTNKIRALDDAEKEIIIKYHETPTHGGDGVYVGKDQELGKKIRLLNAIKFTQKKTKKMEDSKIRAMYIAKKQKTAA